MTKHKWQLQHKTSNKFHNVNCTAQSAQGLSYINMAGQSAINSWWKGGDFLFATTFRPTTDKTDSLPVQANLETPTAHLHPVPKARNDCTYTYTYGKNSHLAAVSILYLFTDFIREVCFFPGLHKTLPYVFQTNSSHFKIRPGSGYHELLYDLPP